MSVRSVLPLLLGFLVPFFAACSSNNATSGGPATGGDAGASSGASGGAQSTSGNGGYVSVGGSDAAAGSGATSTGGAAGAGGASQGGSAPLAGAAGNAGQGGVDIDAVQPTAGCNKDVGADVKLGQFSEVMLAGRKTWVRLPTAYDPSHAYPIIFVWKGCSAAGVTPYGIDKVAGNDAIIAQGDFPPGDDCYDTGDVGTFSDLPVFDALLEHVETNYCADKAHVFSVGFSSGAWLTQLLACQRGDVLRGIGTIAGAFKPAFMKGGMCTGNGLTAFMVSDLDDHTNPFYDEDKDGDSVEVAVNHWLVANKCTEQMWTMANGTPSDPDKAVCRQYSNCGRFPVELCLTSGKGHAAQESLSMPGFWALFQQSLPK